MALSSRVALVIARNFWEIYVIDTRSPVLSIALSDCRRKNEFHNVRFRTNKIYVYKIGRVTFKTQKELHSKHFIKNIFNFFLTADWENPKRISRTT